MQTRPISHVARLAATLVLVFLARTASAQQTVSEVLEFLVTNQSVATGSVERDEAAAAATSATISRALLINLATIPIPSTSGAFAYRLNPTLGTMERSTQSFGPVLLDRALTSGAGTIDVGLTFQHLHYTALDGRNLRNGSLVTTANQFTDEAQPFDVDTLTLKIDADIATLYANAGIGSRVDIGAAVPVVALRVDGSRVNTYRGREFTQAAASANAIGVADVLVRGKATVFEQDGASVAAAVDLRLPTGRQADLLGAGRTSVRFLALGSLEGTRVAAHANAGVSVGGLADEISYGAGLAAAAGNRITFTAEAIGRWSDTPGDIQTVAQPHPTLAGVRTIRLLPGTSRLQTLLLAPGLKWNLSDTWVLAANVGVPLLKGGLRAPLLPFVSLDYSIVR
jgi:hypothetical protein